jgi:hypothetical protein
LAVAVWWNPQSLAISPAIRGASISAAQSSGPSSPPAGPAPATRCVASSTPASSRSVVVIRITCSFCSSRSSGQIVIGCLPIRPATSTVWQNSIRSTNTSMSTPVPGWLKLYRRPSMAISRSRSIT